MGERVISPLLNWPATPRMSRIVINPYVLFDADAVGYFQRQSAAGGTLSSGAMAAVHTFVVVAKANGYWTKLSRVNLMVGDFAGLLVPLKVGAGGATDTNTGFVSGDYSEATGLAGDGSSYLTTGVTPSEITGGDVHVMFCGASLETTGGSHGLIGAYGPTTAFAGFSLASYFGGRRFYCDSNLVTGGNCNATTTSGLVADCVLIGNQSSTTSTKVWQNAVEIASSTNTTGSTITHANPSLVFCENTNGTPANFSTAVCRGYSIGSALTDQNITDFTNDLEAFNDALGRGVI